MTGGCVETADTPRTTAPDTPPNTADSPPQTCDPGPPSTGKGPRRGEATPDLSVRVTEWSQDVEYLSEDDSVRFASHRSGDDSIDTVRDWETWAESQCAMAARDPAVRYVRAKHGAGIDGGVGGSTVFVNIETRFGPDGEVIEEPAVEFDRLVAPTPRTVVATYVLDGHEFTRDVPVYARLVLARLE